MVKLAIHAKCTIDGCEKPRYLRGYCQQHWYRWNRYGSPTAELKLPRRPKEG